MVVLPGGFATRTLVDDADLIGWIRTAERCRYKVSVCSGALLWGAAGFLRGRRVTTHPDARKQLASYGAQVAHERIVDDGDVITCGGVTAAIDLGLYLTEKFAETEARARIATQMDYPWGASIGRA